MAKKWLDSIGKQKRRSNLKFLKKIAKISLPWQQIKIRRTTFCSCCHGELMAKKWLNSIEKQRRRIDFKERYKQTDEQAGRRLDSAPSANVVAMATRLGRARFCMVALNRPATKIPQKAETSAAYLPYKSSYRRFQPKFRFMATRVDPTTFCMVPFNRPSPKTPSFNSSSQILG